jgi:prepilin-type N-terminal cleavage/methylation domain-containing protein
MKKTITHGFSLIEMLICICVIALFAALALPARADTGLVPFGITNSITATATNTTAPAIGSAVKIDNQEQVGIYFSGKLTGAGTSAQTFIIARSYDGTNSETAPFWTNSVTMAGTAVVTKYWQIPVTDVGSVPYLMVTSVGNANATIGTNHTFGVIKKNIR